MAGCSWVELTLIALVSGTKREAATWIRHELVYLWSYTEDAVCRKCSVGALPIYRGLSSNNSREAPISRPLGQGMGVFRAIIVWPKFYLRIQCTVWCVVLYGTAIYWEYSMWLQMEISFYYNSSELEHAHDISCAQLYTITFTKTYISIALWQI